MSTSSLHSLFEAYSLYNHKIEMDKSGLAIWTDEPSDTFVHSDIIAALARKNIYAFAKSWTNRPKGIDIPLNIEKQPQKPPISPTDRLNSVLEILGQSKLINPVTSQEVSDVWKTLPTTYYYFACSKRTPLPFSTSNNHKMDKWVSENETVVFQPVPPAFQNVILYDLAKKKNVHSNKQKNLEFHQDLIEIARTKKFPATRENIRLYEKGFTQENLTTPGTDGLNPLDHAFHSRNAALTRSMLYHTTAMTRNKLINRACLNAILREIDAIRPTFDKLAENPIKELSNVLSNEGLLDNFSPEDLKDLDKYICSWFNAAADVYAFLLAVLSSGFQSLDIVNELWMNVEHEGIVRSGKHKKLFDCFDKDVVLKETINAFILDRIFKWIENKMPMKKKLILEKVYKIYAAFPSELITNKAQAIVRDPSSDPAKLIASLTGSLSNIIRIQKVNQILGEEFVKKYGSKWRVDSSSETYYLNNVSVAEKQEIQERLKVGKVMDYQFIPISGRGFRFTLQGDRVTLDDLLPKQVKTPSSNSTSSTSSTEEAHLAKRYLVEAEEFLKTNELNSAINRLDQLIALNPEDKLLLSKAFCLKAQTHYKRVQSQKAIDAYQSLFKLNNLERDVLDRSHFECGAAYHALNQLEDASRHYGIVIDNLNADNKIKAEALMNRAAIFTEQGNPVEALKDTEEAVKAGEAANMDPDVLEIWKEQRDSLRYAAARFTARPKATSSMVTGR